MQRPCVTTRKSRLTIIFLLSLSIEFYTATENHFDPMITTGQTIANPVSGGLGIVLNVREIAQTADGSVLAEYDAIEVRPGKETGLSKQRVADFARASLIPEH